MARQEKFMVSISNDSVVYTRHPELIISVDGIPRSFGQVNDDQLHQPGFAGELFISLSISKLSRENRSFLENLASEGVAKFTVGEFEFEGIVLWVYPMADGTLSLKVVESRVAV
jgi:hypothetical protein